MHARHPIRPLARVTLGLAALTLAAACRGRSQTAEPAHAQEVDWSQVTPRDLDIASLFLVARDRGVRPALDSLSVLVRADPSLEPLGHQVAHGLGRYAVAQRGYDAGVFAECRPSFFSGCYHGVLEGWLAGHPGATAASLRGICSQPAMARMPPYAYRECAHGLGHGLTEMHDHDALAAIPDCDTALPTDLARRECYDGVFMENVVRGMGTVAFDVREAPSPHHMHGDAARTLPKAGDPNFPCDSVSGVAAPSCWAYQPVVLFTALNGDVGRISRTCDAAPGESAAACYRGIGKQTLGRMPEHPDSVVHLCASSPRHAADCIAGMVEFYVDQEWKADSALAFCATVAGAMGDACYRAVGERVAWIDPAPAAIRAACAGAGSHAATCVQAAEAERVADALPRTSIAMPTAAAAQPSPSPPAGHAHTPP